VVKRPLALTGGVVVSDVWIKKVAFLMKRLNDVFVHEFLILLRVVDTALSRVYWDEPLVVTYRFRLVEFGDVERGICRVYWRKSFEMEIRKGFH
jgi:hypothetical protein